MALSGNQKAYLSARAGIARAGASRSNYLFPLYGVVVVNGIDLTAYIQYGTLRVALALNEQPDTAAFDVLLTDPTVAATVDVGADVLIGLGGGPNLIFGGRILTTQTTVSPGRTPRRRSVLCADYLQVLDSEYLITYDWPPQSASITILDLIQRFANRAGGLTVSAAGVAAGLPSLARLAVANERFSTVLRRIVTLFPDGGGFYVDAEKVLHVWRGASEPNVDNPSPLTLDNPQLKTFAESEDGSQQRDAALVEGMRTTAPLGSPGPDPALEPWLVASVPVVDSSIVAPTPTEEFEVRIGTQRLVFQDVVGAWLAPVGTPLTTTVTAAVAFNPDPAIESNQVTIFVESLALVTWTSPAGLWLKIDEQYVRVLASGTTPTPHVVVPRTGYGAVIGPIAVGAAVTFTDAFVNGAATGRYDAPEGAEQVRPQPRESDVVLTVRSGTAVAEQLVQDGRFSRNGAAARGASEIADFQSPLISIQFETEDLNARPGRRQVYALDDPVAGTLSGAFMILTAELTWPVWGQPPRRQCQAADVHAANIVDAWLVDPR